MLLRDIKRTLRTHDPDQFPNAVYLGEGVDKIAYRVGDYVIKAYCGKLSKTGKPRPEGHHSSSIRKVRKAFHTLGLSRIRQWFVCGRRGQWYIIQPMVEVAYECGPYGTYRLPSRLRYILDIHEQNVGRTQYGKYVAFDW